MKIVVHTPTELIIRNSAAPLRWFGAFIIALAAFVLLIGVGQDPDGGVAIVPTIIGCVLLLGGALMVVLPRNKTFAFSKAERVFIIAKERFGRVERQMIPLANVADVRLDSSNSDDGSTYRVVTILADQRRVPWTSYYTSAYASKRAVVESVRDFLGLEPSPTSASELVFGAGTRERDARRGRIGLYAMGAFCSLFLGIGVTLLVKEQRRLTLYAPVTATVLSTRIQAHDDSEGGTTYEPVVVYRYYVNDREYTASRVTPLKESRSGRWARRVTGRYAIGSEHTAYYDPENPGEAFLLRSRSVIPWGFIVIPLVGIIIIGAAIRSSREASRLSHAPPIAR